MWLPRRTCPRPVPRRAGDRGGPSGRDGTPRTRRAPLPTSRLRLPRRLAPQARSPCRSGRGARRGARCGVPVVRPADLPVSPRPSSASDHRAARRCAGVGDHGAPDQARAARDARARGTAGRGAARNRLRGSARRAAARDGAAPAAVASGPTQPDVTTTGNPGRPGRGARPGRADRRRAVVARRCPRPAAPTGRGTRRGPFSRLRRRRTVEPEPWPTEPEPLEPVALPEPPAASGPSADAWRRAWGLPGAGRSRVRPPGPMTRRMGDEAVDPAARAGARDRRAARRLCEPAARGPAGSATCAGLAGARHRAGGARARGCVVVARQCRRRGALGGRPRGQERRHAGARQGGRRARRSARRAGGRDASRRVRPGHQGWGGRDHGGADGRSDRHRPGDGHLAPRAHGGDPCARGPAAPRCS